MTSALRIAIVACCLIIALLPAAAGGYVAATGLAVVEMNDREVDYRLTVVPSELPEAASQLLARSMAGSRPDAEQETASNPRSPCGIGRRSRTAQA